MWISYSDSEVNVFHPICEDALTQALRRLQKDELYQVVHHQHTGSLEMDFAIQNKATGKYFCVIEIKRTPTDVHSARYQFQAMSYVQMNVAQNEKPFYILTNLEKAFAFRFDSTRPRVFQQMLKPGLITVGNFSEGRDQFIEKLILYFTNQLGAFFNDSYEYLVTLEEFAFHMEQIKNSPKKWKSHIAILLYEYIRGAFTFINRNELPDIRVFRNDIERICNEAARINFKDIFTYNTNDFENPSFVESSILSDLFDFGYQNISGDSISNILHQIVSQGHEHEGEVPTDLELARCVAILAKNISGNISHDSCVCDPAAGSGNLISAAIDVYNLLPNQILVNDWNHKLIELLSLRLGLNFASQICTTNSPKITSENIARLNRDYFDRVNVIIMNPPFVAGINCVERKQILYSAINAITRGNCKTNIGQMPLEAVFLELITHLVQPGTTIACVFPKTHLTARGNEAQAIRSLILRNLGLHTVFTYPGEDIFNEVTKDTCVLVGKAMNPCEEIKVFSAYEKIPDLDSLRFQQAITMPLSENFSAVMPGMVGRKVLLQEMVESVSTGWRALNSEMVEGIRFVKDYLNDSNKFITLTDLHFQIKRGSAGNSGASDLMFFDSREELFNRYVNSNVILKPGMRNAKFDSFFIGNGDSRFLDIESNDDLLIEDIINTYIHLPTREGRQQRKTKSKADLKGILQYESRNIFNSNSVLIPRAIRKEGKAYLSENPVFVSTNFVVCTTNSYKEALLLSTWANTIFYQLICEVASKDQEGMRKMEVGDIATTLVPKLNNIPESIFEILNEAAERLTFLNLREPNIRDVDRIWAEFLFGDSAESLLEDAKRLLSFLANKRDV